MVPLQTAVEVRGVDHIMTERMVENLLAENDRRGPHVRSYVLYLDRGFARQIWRIGFASFTIFLRYFTYATDLCCTVR